MQRDSPLDDVQPDAPVASPAAASEGVQAAAHAPEAVQSLRAAMRRARSDEAERAGAKSELRAARLGRLELLQDALQPLLAQIPRDIDLFDVALVPSSDPRLFIDMIGFVDTGRDARVYRLHQDTRHGRILVAESQSLDTMVEAVTDYVARRLLERDKALAADARARAGGRATAMGLPPSAAGTGSTIAARTDGEAYPTLPPAVRPAPLSPIETRRAWPLRWLGIAFAFLIDLLGAVTLFTILGALGWFLYNRIHPPL